jgi:hypothetical protein
MDAMSPKMGGSSMLMEPSWLPALYEVILLWATDSCPSQRDCELLLA